MTPHIAVLIDFENISSPADVETVLKVSEERGSVVAKKAFGDWAGPIENGQEELTKLGVELVHQMGIGKGRNGCDMKLVIDAMDLLHDSQQRIDMFVLVTCDVDFVPLVVRLRSAGKLVIAAGRPEVTSDLLIATVDEFVRVGRHAQAAPNAEDSPKHRGHTNTPGSNTHPILPNEPHNSPPETRETPAPPLGKDTKLLVMSAIFDLTLRNNHVVKGAPLHQSMKAIDPSFDFKTLGFPTFADLLESHEQLEVHGRGLPGDIIVTVKDNVSKNEPTP